MWGHSHAHGHHSCMDSREADPWKSPEFSILRSLGWELKPLSRGQGNQNSCRDTAPSPGAEGPLFQPPSSPELQVFGAPQGEAPGVLEHPPALVPTAPFRGNERGEETPNLCSEQFPWKWGFNSLFFLGRKAQGHR